MSEQPGSLAAALIALQAQLPRITKGETAEVPTKTGGKYTYSYASLSAIHDIILPLLASVGLAWICLPTLTAGGHFVLLYKLVHAATGEEETGEYPLPESGGSQVLGSAITYARRYALCAVTGIAPADDDDDGEASKGSDWRAPANPRSRKATRSRGMLPDDEWTTHSDTETEQQPGSISEGQLQGIGIQFGKLGIRDRTDRLALVTSLLDLKETPESSKQLSYAQGIVLARRLEQEIAKEGK